MARTRTLSAGNVSPGNAAQPGATMKAVLVDTRGFQMVNFVDDEVIHTDVPIVASADSFGDIEMQLVPNQIMRADSRYRITLTLERDSGGETPPREHLIYMPDRNSNLADLIAGTPHVVPPPQMHRIYAGWSPDASIDASEIVAGAESMSNTLTLPDATGSMYMFIWRSQNDGGAPSEVHIAGGGNSRNLYGAPTAQAVEMIDGELIVSVNTFNATLLSGTNIRLV